MIRDRDGNYRHIGIRNIDPVALSGGGFILQGSRTIIENLRKGDTVL